MYFFLQDTGQYFKYLLLYTAKCWGIYELLFPFVCPHFLLAHLKCWMDFDGIL